jgi:hypothetical protein
LTVIESDWRSDLALLRLADHRVEEPLKVLFDAQLTTNTDLVTFAYAQTVASETGDFILNTALRKGHITRLVPAPAMGPIAGELALELSFPALQGASGAPVMFDSTPFVREEQKWGIIGVLASNAEYHAMPAQVISLLKEGNSYLEERRYMLPQGLAININHLRPMYERVVGSPKQ